MAARKQSATAPTTTERADADRKNLGASRVNNVLKSLDRLGTTNKLSNEQIEKASDAITDRLAKVVVDLRSRQVGEGDAFDFS